MAFSTSKTQAELRTMCRNLLMDPNGRIWPDAVLNSYINDWHQDVQTELELVKGTATYTTTSTASSIASTALASDAIRIEASYWDGKRLVPRNPEDMFQLNKTYRSVAQATPEVIIPVSPSTYELFPPPLTTGVIESSYVKDISLTTNTSTSDIPTWAVYSCPYYVAYRAYGKDSQLNDVRKHKGFKALYSQMLTTLKSLWSHRTPLKYPTLRPSGRFQSDILKAKH